MNILPSVSVIIPAYNEEKLLPRCLESLQNQTVSPLEVIVVDNNSIDSTAQIAKNHGVILVPEKRQGIAWARDAGFNCAKGDVIARLDADCVAPPEWVEVISKYYQENSLDKISASAITGMGYYTTRSVASGKVLGTITTTGYNTGNRLLMGSVALFGSCMAFPKNWWKTVKEEVCHDSHSVHEDVDLSSHLIKKGYRIKRLAGFYTYIDSRPLSEPISKTWWRFKIWPRSAQRHRRKNQLSNH